jgi:tRNA-splicing ligase RtcB
MLIEIGGKPVHIYGFTEIDEATKSQFYDAVKQDYIIRGALMPDAHKGYSLPIGGVVACENAIVPAYVGYDIGCGMCAFKLKGVGASEIKRHADQIFSMIYRRVPVGQDWHKEDRRAFWENGSRFDIWGISKFLQDIMDEKGFRQLGTLGGGNHFIEIGVDTEKNVWIIIHSGSRNVGHNVATHYMRIAGGGKVREGHYPLRLFNMEGMTEDEAFAYAKDKRNFEKIGNELSEDERAMQYIHDMHYCLEFALANRKEMGVQVVQVIEHCIGHKIDVASPIINRNHNHAENKRVDGKNVWIHRKGATHADAGMLGVIPGNMKDGSFIVRGLGNEDALCSSSHGAGRLYSRTKAKEVLSVTDFKKEMSDITAKVGKSTLDESSGAYKDIFGVMENQEELVEVITHVRPLINIKA